MNYVYILTNQSNSVLYTGVTSNLQKRLSEHISESIPGFTKKYHVHKLVYVEEHSEICDAIEREKQIKGWCRKKKLALISLQNPNWTDLRESLI